MKKYLLTTVLLLIIVFDQSFLYSQCCAFGTPTAGTANIGTLPKNNLRTTFFYRYGDADKYYLGRDIASIPGIMKSSEYNFMGFSLGYGITEKWTIETELGYFLAKSQQLRSVPIGYSDIIENSGLTNLILSGKYNLIKNYDFDIEWSLGAGVKIPLNLGLQGKDGVDYSIDMQTSTRAFGLVFQSYFKKSFVDLDLNIFLVNRIEFNDTDSLNYRIGNTYSTSLFASKKIIDGLFGIIQLRNEIKEKDVNVENPDNKIPSGSSLIFISPQSSYTYKDLNCSILYEYPIYRNYYDKQLAVNNSFSINFSYLIDLND